MLYLRQQNCSSISCLRVFSKNASTKTRRQPQGWFDKIIYKLVPEKDYYMHKQFTSEILQVHFKCSYKRSFLSNSNFNSDFQIQTVAFKGLLKSCISLCIFRLICLLLAFLFYYLSAQQSLFQTFLTKLIAIKIYNLLRPNYGRNTAETSPLLSNFGIFRNWSKSQLQIAECNLILDQFRLILNKWQGTYYDRNLLT